MTRPHNILLHTAIPRGDRRADHGQWRHRPAEVVRHPGAVTILPLVDADHVCLIRNYRMAVARTLIELPPARSSL